MSIRRIKAISYKEFIHLFRDIRSLMVIILVPVILLVLFGYALKLDVENVSIGVIDYSNSEKSREYISYFDSTNAFDVNCDPWSECKIRPSLIGGWDSNAFWSVRMARSLVILQSVILATTLRSCRSKMVQL